MVTCTFENGNKAQLRHVVIDTLVLEDNKLLMVKRAEGLLEAGKWALIGGYVEQDETIQQALEREVFEESGYRVKDIILFRIIDNPKRPNEDRQNISFVYFCMAGEKEGESDWEVDEAKWFPFDELPNEDDIAFDHSDNIKLYKQYQKQQFLLPLLK